MKFIIMMMMMIMIIIIIIIIIHFNSTQLIDVQAGQHNCLL